MMEPETDTPAEPTRNFGKQPIEALMAEHGLGNHDVVAASEEPMTHKAVQRARYGRKLTPHMKRRMVTALNRAVTLQGKTLEAAWRVSDLFTY
jgi:hypothetical protein